MTTTTHKILRGPRGRHLDEQKENWPTSWTRRCFPACRAAPHSNTTAAIAVALKEARQPEFKEYCRQVVKNAAALAEALMEQGFDLVTGGTDNHLVLIDVTRQGVTGKELSPGSGSGRHRGQLQQDPL